MLTSCSSNAIENNSDSVVILILRILRELLFAQDANLAFSVRGDLVLFHGYCTHPSLFRRNTIKFRLAHLKNY